MKKQLFTALFIFVGSLNAASDENPLEAAYTNVSGGKKGSVLQIERELATVRELRKLLRSPAHIGPRHWMLDYGVPMAKVAVGGLASAGIAHLLDRTPAFRNANVPFGATAGVAAAGLFGVHEATVALWNYIQQERRFVALDNLIMNWPSYVSQAPDELKDVMHQVHTSYARNGKLPLVRARKKDIYNFIATTLAHRELINKRLLSAEKYKQKQKRAS